MLLAPPLRPSSLIALELPLIAAQPGIWMGDQVSPTRNAFIVAQYVELKGAVDVESFRLAIRIGLSEADTVHARFIEAEGAAQMLKNAKVRSTAAGTSPANMTLEVIANRADIHVNDDWLVRRLVEAHKDQLAEMPAYTDKPWRLNAVSWSVAKGQAGMLNVLNVAIDRLLDNNLFYDWDKKYGANWMYKKDVYVLGSKLT